MPRLHYGADGAKPITGETHRDDNNNDENFLHVSARAHETVQDRELDMVHYLSEIKSLLEQINIKLDILVT